jgi:hypothetical protein
MVIDSAPVEWVQGLKRASGWEKFYNTAVEMTKLVIEKHKKDQQRVNGINQLLQ